MLYCSNCSKVIRPYDIWFLFDKKQFDHRSLELGRCPKCKRDLVALNETSVIDGRTYIDRQYGQKAADLIDKCITSLWYRQQDLGQNKGTPYGFIYGENKEQKKGIVVYACDFFGNKELVQRTENLSS